MNNAIDFVTDDGFTVKIEPAQQRRQGAHNVSKQNGTATGQKHLDDVLLRIRKVAESVSSQINGFSEIPGGPSGAEVEFGISVSAEADAVILKGNGEATFKVTLTWSGPHP